MILTVIDALLDTKEGKERASCVACQCSVYDPFSTKI